MGCITAPRYPQPGLPRPFGVASNRGPPRHPPWPPFLLYEGRRSPAARERPGPDRVGLVAGAFSFWSFWVFGTAGLFWAFVIMVSSSCVWLQRIMLSKPLYHSRKNWVTGRPATKDIHTNNSMSTLAPATSHNGGSIEYPPHTYWCCPPVSREYQYWLQPVALTG